MTHKFEMLVSSLIHEIILKSVLFYKKIMLRENYANRESKSLEITV